MRNLEVKQREFIGLVEQPGSGKSKTLRMFADPKKVVSKNFKLKTNSLDHSTPKDCDFTMALAVRVMVMNDGKIGYIIAELIDGSVSCEPDLIDALGFKAPQHMPNG
ncbi:MAG: ABC-type dipeptide/oligopeptide/nickel transport system ATPase component [Yoonia sp.]